MEKRAVNGVMHTLPGFLLGNKRSEEGRVSEGGGLLVYGCRWSTDFLFCYLCKSPILSLSLMWHWPRALSQLPLEQHTHTPSVHTLKIVHTSQTLPLPFTVCEIQGKPQSAKLCPGL